MYGTCTHGTFMYIHVHRVHSCTHGASGTRGASCTHGAFMYIHVHMVHSCTFKYTWCIMYTWCIHVHMVHSSNIHVHMVHSCTFMYTWCIMYTWYINIHLVHVKMFSCKESHCRTGSDLCLHSSLFDGGFNINH